MDKKQYYLLESVLIEKLQGKFNLFQSFTDKEALVEQALNEIFLNDQRDELQALKVPFASSDYRSLFTKDFLSYGIIQDILCEGEVEDIIINSLNEIFIHHGQKGFIPTGRRFQNLQVLDLFIKKLLLFANRSRMTKIMNMELPNLDGRINIALSPFGPQITITKAKLTPLSIIDLIRRKTLTYEVTAQLWLYLEGLSIRPANMIIAGGPGVGKTTLLNALFSFIPKRERMVVIEDTLELNTFLDESCSRLESDEDVSLSDLVKNSLRMRPERIVIGEVRGKEAQDMMTAANVGKYCIGTIHALTSREAIIRLQNEPMNIPETLVNLIDVFVVIKRYHTGDKVFRVVDEVSETSGMEQVKVLLAQIYKYNYDTKQIRSMGASTVYRDRLAHQSGLTPQEIINEVRLRAFLLHQLDERNMSTIKEVTTFCQSYSQDKEAAVAGLGLERAKLLSSKKPFG